MSMVERMKAAMVDDLANVQVLDVFDSEDPNRIVIVAGPTPQTCRVVIDLDSLARAAIAAMREPTEAMTAAAHQAWQVRVRAKAARGYIDRNREEQNSSLIANYEAMIDAALSEDKP